MLKLKLALSLFVIILMASCTSGPKINPDDIQKKFTIETDYDVAWSAVIETFAELNLPIDNMEKDSGLITTDWISFTSDYCDCGSAPLATELSREGKFNVFLKPVDEGVSLVVNTKYQVMRDFMDTISKTPCVSTGKLEQIIADRVTETAGLP